MSNEPKDIEAEELQGEGVEAKILQMEAAFEKMLVSHRKGVRTAKIVAVVVPLVILGYLSFLYVHLSAFLRPEDLVDTIEGLVRRSMPDAVTRVERFVTDDVPQLAESYLVEAEKSIGDLRKEAEKAILDYSQQTLTGLSGEAKRHMAQIINRNKDMLKDALEELSEDKGGEIFKNALKLEINKLLEKEIGRAQVVAALGKYKRPLMDVQKKLDMLKNTPFEKLNEEQQLERRLIVLGRALLLESKKE